MAAFEHLKRGAPHHFQLQNLGYARLNPTLSPVLPRDHHPINRDRRLVSSLEAEMARERERVIERGGA